MTKGNHCGTTIPMNAPIFDSKINVRLPKPVVMHLRKLALAEELKVSDIVRKAIKKTYGHPKKVS